MNFLKLRLSQQTLGLTLAEVMIVRATCQKELALKFDMLERESFNRVSYSPGQLKQELLLSRPYLSSSLNV